MMELFHWILNNFGLLFGPVFLTYIYLMIRRLTTLYDFLRLVPVKEQGITRTSEEVRALNFLDNLFDRLTKAVSKRAGSVDSVIDTIWSEVDCRISIHFTALHGYANTLILIGFAGTIFGSIGAFNEMFEGLSRGESAAVVFVASWNNGLATALYTSLGAAAIGSIVNTLLCSRFFMTRRSQIEIMVGLRITDIIEEAYPCHAEEEETVSPLKARMIREKTSLLTSSS